MLTTSNFKVNPEPLSQERISQQSLENLPDIQNDENRESSDSEPSWKEKYEKMWVEHEKKEVKSHFKDITAELKHKFGEITKMKKSPSKTSKSQDEDSSSSSRDLEKCLVQGAKTSNDIVMYPDGVDKDDKSLVNSESTDWSEDTKSKIQERLVVSPDRGKKGSNLINPQEKEKHPYRFGLSNLIMQKNLEPKSTLSTKHLGKSISNPEKLANGLAKDKFGSMNKKESDVPQTKSYNQKLIDNHHQLKEHLLQALSNDTTNKHLDKQLEQDMRRFKNEVGGLQLEFLNLTKEKSQLQKEVEVCFLQALFLCFSPEH